MKIAMIATPSLPCTVIALVLALGGVAQADSAIEKAESQLADLRFDDARDTATSALKEGSRGPGEVVELYMLLGQVSAAMGKDSDAIDNFHNALSIDGAASLPDGASPKLSEPFDAAKARLKGASPIAIQYEAKDKGRVIVTITSDPAKLVGGAALLYKDNGADQIKKGRGLETVKMKVPDGATDLKVVAVDNFGNQINEAVALELGQSGGSEEVEVATTTNARRGRPLLNRWQLYAGLAVGAAVGGGYFGFKSRGLVKDAEALEDGAEFTQARKLEDKAKSQALYANISFVAAALLAGTTYWVYSTNEKREKASPAATSTTFAPYLTPDEVGAMASFQF